MTRHASVQAALPLDDIQGDLLCLRGGEYRGVLEAGSVNFALKSEPEQEAILAGYRRFLNGLAYPLQVLVRIVPADVDAYLAGLRSGRARGDAVAWRRLAADHEAFVRRLARERTLLDRRCYVVVPAGTEEAAQARRSLWPRRHGGRTGARPAVLAARRALAFRCGEVSQGLGAIGVRTRRIEGGELADLWQAALAGTPLARAVLGPASAVQSIRSVREEAQDA